MTTLEEHLRQALKHIYDPAVLRKSPLIQLFDLSGRPDAVAVLRDMLQAEIEALKPPPGAPPDLPERRYYGVLFYRYIQQCTQQAVAEQMALSPRHLRREQDRALLALAERLRARFALPNSVTASEPVPPADDTTTRRTRLDQEIAWLKESLADEDTEVRPALHDALTLARILADGYGVRLVEDDIPNLPPVAVAPTVFEQIVLNLIAAAVRAVPKGEVQVTANLGQGEVIITIKAIAAQPGDQQTPSWDVDSVRTSRQLARAFKGSISVRAEGATLLARISLPSNQTATLLAIEDNADTLQLWRRYVQNSPYRLISLSDPEQLWELVGQTQPSAIILDVMMPGLDGWKLLKQLRSEPATCHIPVIVCTVLPQEELALSLGASGFIRKPATRQEFLAAIDRQLARKTET